MSIRQIYYLLTLSFFFIKHAVSQIDKANKYYDKAQYIKAIPLLKREINKKKSLHKQEALIKLGNCYRNINDYLNSENAYRQAIEAGGDIHPQAYYDYAQVLKTNSRYEEAIMQFENYIKMAPDDGNAKKALKFCKEIKYFLTQPAEFKVHNITNINTERAEFSPFVNHNKLMFVAERESFDFVNYEVNNYNGQPFLNMFVANLEGDRVKKSKTLSKSINTESHNGPACVSSDGHTLYFTRVIGNVKKDVTNNSKIYQASGTNSKWNNIKEIPSLNNNDYSIAHPSISANDSVLYFTSNMPGGYGGKDLYMSARNGDGWGQAINLGPDINTSGDEMFPCIRKDGILFFSSTGLPGFGGMDIYTAKQIDSKWILQRNEGIEINSPTDDFGITFLNDSTGYFSSNRPGGKGNDDIYIYHYTNRSMEIDGIVLLTENKRDFAKHKKIILIDEKNRFVDSVLTNENGYFSFKHLNSTKKYMAVVVEDNPLFSTKARYYLANSDSVIQRVSHKISNRRYAFKNLPVDPNSLPDLYTDDNLVFAGILTSDNKALGNVKVKIINEAGQVLEEVITDDKGNFVFRNIPTDQNYIVTLNEEDIRLEDGAKITLTTRSGKEIKSFYKNKEPFTYKILGGDKTILTEMKEEEVIPVFAGTLKSGDKVLGNVKMKIIDENGSVLEEVTTDAYGNFVFKKIPADQNYIVSINEEDVALEEGQKVSLISKAGKEIKSFYKNKETFSFKILSTDKSMITEMPFEEPEAPVFAGSLKSGNKALKNVRVKMVNELGEVIEEAVTDEKGNFVFRNIPSDKNYILSVEEEDVNLGAGSKITLASQAGKEVKSFYKNQEEFQFKILSTDKRVIEEMFVEDVDLVMQIYGYIYNQNKKPLANVKLTVKDEDETNEIHLITNDVGKFSFRNLKEEKNYIFEADATDPNLKGTTRIYIADSKGRIYKVVELQSGKFAFKILEADKNAMGEFLIDEPSMELAEKKKAEKKIELARKEKEMIDGKEYEGKGANKTEEPKQTIEPEPELSITVIENIYYTYGNYNIDPDGEQILSEVAEVLLQNRHLTVEINSHTDCRSSDAFNLKLSNKRAQTIVNFLVEKGVARKRLKAVGYGETRLLNQCGNDATCTEEEHKINRRTEFKITKLKTKR